VRGFAKTETALLLQRIITPRLASGGARSTDGRHSGVPGVPHALQLLDSNLPPDSIHFDRALGARSAICIGVLVMGTEHLPRNKQGRLAEPSLGVDETTDGAGSLLEENALRGDEPSLWADEHSDDLHSLLEENARLRKLLVQVSDLIRRNVVHAR
jgi:hypothetical protein